VKFHPEAAAFCLAWVALAVVAIVLQGWLAGALIGMGLLAILGPTTATILSRTNDFTLERTVRWSILIAAGALLALVHALRN
jgi:hypothetical protein